MAPYKQLGETEQINLTLRAVEPPLHFAEITQRALARKLIVSQCHTFVVIMTSQRVGGTKNWARELSRPHHPIISDAAANSNYSLEDS